MHENFSGRKSGEAYDTLVRTPGLPKGRRLDIELARIIAAFGIVWYHVEGQKSEIAYSGLIFFIILSIYLNNPKSSVKEQIKEKLTRLIKPWILWSAIYAAIKLATGSQITPKTGLSTFEIILTGPAPHLWYLPFIFISIITLNLARGPIKHKQSWLILVTACVSILLTAKYWANNIYLIHMPWAQWLHAAPAVLMGATLHQTRAATFATKVITTFAILAAILLTPHQIGITIPYIIGFSCTAAINMASHIKTQGTFVSTISNCTLGIYLVHPLVAAVLRRYIELSGGTLAIASFTLSLLLIGFGREYSRTIKNHWT